MVNIPLDEINRILKKRRVSVAFVFGSYAQNKVTPLSDFDIAVFFDKKVSAAKYFNEELAIAGEIGRLLKINRVDVVNLNKVTSPLLRFNSIIRGKIILSENNSARQYLQKRALMEYEDTHHLRSILASSLKKQAEAGIFGKF